MLLLQPWGLIFRLLDRLLKHSEDVYVRNLTMIDCKIFPANAFTAFTQMSLFGFKKDKKTTFLILSM